MSMGFGWSSLYPMYNLTSMGVLMGKVTFITLDKHGSISCTMNFERK